MKKKRLQQVMDILQERQSLESAEASEMLGVSLPTIRRDFEWLASQGMVRRFHGGIAVLEGDGNSIFPIAMRRTLSVKIKEELAAVVAESLPSSGAIFIDGGTTTACLGPFLANPRLRIITNSIALLRRVGELPEPHAKITMTGGDYNQTTDNLLGIEALRTISHYHADLSIISCTALDGNFLYADPEETAAVQQAMSENSDRILLVADSSKFGKHALYKSLPMEKIHALVTDNVPENGALLDAIRQKGVEVMLN